MDYIFGPLKYHLYLLQLENYNLPRYWQLLFRRWNKTRDQPRQALVKTPKARLLFFLTVGLALFLAVTLASFRDNYWMKVLTFVLYFILYIGLLPSVFLSLAVLIIWPADYFAKQVIIWRAKARLRGFPGLKIIGITGSYGKTTMKEALAAALGEKYKVLKTRENINTLIGISRQILRELDENTQIYIVEMGAYHKGDIRGMCRLVQPQIAILTGINEAHLERFGSIENTIEAKYEIVASASENALVLLNRDNQLVRDNYEHFIGKRQVIWYSATNVQQMEFITPTDAPPYIRGEIEGINFQTQILGNYISGMIQAGILLARHLGLSDEEIKRGIEKLRPITHRLQPIFNPQTGILVIDDSYNGNPEGASEAIEVLAKFPDRRKIYVTPGLVEMGKQTGDVHYKLGKHLSVVASLAVLIKNSVTPFIAQGLLDHEFSPENILWFDSAQEAHAAIPRIVKSGDVVLFQNDWPDNYV